MDSSQLTTPSLTYARGNSYTYDNDSLMTAPGPFTITRGAQTGFIESVSDGTATLMPTYNGYGESSELVMDVGLTSALCLQDKLRSSPFRRFAYTRALRLYDGVSFSRSTVASLVRESCFAQVFVSYGASRIDSGCRVFIDDTTITIPTPTTPPAETG